ncbi:hypothetical protein DRQ18_02165 [bacterium]|nr:MAG: hypothetical protein DRQ18_02165 [bacterium]
MRKSIFSRIFAGYLLLTFFLSGFILSFSFKVIRTHYLDSLAENLERIGNALKPSVYRFLEKGKGKELDNFIKQMGEKINVRITVIDKDGVVIADSKKNPETMENHSNRPEIREAYKGKTGRSLRFSTTVKETMLYVAIPLERNGEVEWVVRTSLFLKQINTLLHNLRRKILETAGVVLLLSLIGAIFITRTVSVPLRKLSIAARKIASGDFDVRVELKNRDELQELAVSFNHMAEEIKKLFTTITLQKEELDGILSSIQEGLVVMSKDGKIIRANKSMKKITGISDMEGKMFWEIFLLNSPSISSLIKNSIETGKSMTEEVSIGDRRFLSSITHMKTKNEVVLVLHDITRLKKLEEFKKDLVMNVSHELRTPLTAIYGYLETLEEEMEEEKKHYVDIIKKHTWRLINLVNDLLTLSELEKKGEIDYEDVDITRMVNQIMKFFEKKAKEKGIMLKASVPENLHMKGDGFRLEQMLLNLVDNAIKYTESGEVEILVRKKKKNIEFRVRDTGMGIPPECIPRIFERFYVVNKARSRELGGTGLGLSIVKHIVELHGGEIFVESTPGKGSTFTVIIPQN